MERLMHAAKVEKGHIEMHGGFEMAQALAESQAQPRKAPQLCPHAEIGSLDMASGDSSRMRVPGDGCRYRRSDATATQN
jgi:hypothetical protein